MMDSKRTHLVFIVILVTVKIILGQLTEEKAKPVGYVSFLPSNYDEDTYNIVHSIGKCNPSVEVVDGDRNEDVIICPNGELLLDGATETNLEDDVTDSDIRVFYTWKERSIPLKDAFITLQFPSEPITPTKVVVYYLELRGLKVREPRAIRLYSSTTERIFPDDEIRDLDDSVFTINTGITAQDDQYEYRRYNLIIPENRQVSLNYLRISLAFERGSWVFISEVEVYHLSQASHTTTTSATTATAVITPTAAVTATETTVPTTSVTVTASIPYTTVPTPTFIFPIVNPHLLHVTDLLSDLTINCTVMLDGDTSRLTILWFYNGTTLSSNEKYKVTDNRLTISYFIPEDVGVYTCTVQHPSGWNSSRQYFISTSQDDDEQPGKDNSSTSNSPIPIVVAVAGGGVGLILCVILITCGTVYFYQRRKQTNDKPEPYLVTQKSLPPSQPYDYIIHTTPSTEHKGLTDNGYEDMSITSATIKGKPQNKTSIPPTLPKLPECFKIVELLKPQLPQFTTDDNDVYGILGEYIKMNTSLSPSLSSTNEIFFNLYEDIASPYISPIPQSSQNIYDEILDCSQSTKDITHNDYSKLSMCVPIYDEPKPLAKHDAPKFVEWCNVNVIANIGEGQFGDVFLAETIDVDVTELNAEACGILVAIKILKANHTMGLKQQFEKEIKFMARLDNTNIIKLLGICNKGTPFIMMEYMKNGDLYMFLRKHYHAEIGKDIAAAEIQVDIPILLYIALQVANGMRYLASLGFIHRDLAARNCLVGEDYVIKVADFGMVQKNYYNTAYFAMQGKVLVPIRWLASESFSGKFSTKTDVWSYGVTLWEIFTLCRHQPYEKMTHEELVRDVRKGPNRILLRRPSIAPDEVHNTMKQCWNYDPNQRPDFESVYDQLFAYYTQTQ
ncbi:class II receptor tyrosine kinase-like isoform X2 [Dysidea avara]|uniref:class II receptor tyrosine kinase-like isoform X2 n=1 Tax=Dysidea avara TaxID=196820 RepID=UPI003327EE03